MELNKFVGGEGGTGKIELPWHSDRRADEAEGPGCSLGHTPVRTHGPPSRAATMYASCVTWACRQASHHDCACGLRQALSEGADAVGHVTFAD